MPRRLKLAYYCLCTWILMFSCRSADWLFRPPPYCDVKIRLIFADHKAILHDILWFPMQPYILTYVMICFGPCNLCKRIMHNTTFCTCMHGLRWTGTRNMVKLVIEKPGYFPRISFIFMYIFASRILDHHIDFDNITYFGALLGIVLTFIVIIIVYLNKYKLGLNLLGESKLFKVP